VLVHISFLVIILVTLPLESFKCFWLDKLPVQNIFCRIVPKKYLQIETLNSLSCVRNKSYDLLEL